MLSPGDAGTVLARALLAELILSLLAVGVQMFMCIYGTMLFCDTSKAIRRGRGPYIILSWVLWTLLCIDTFVDADFLYRALMNSREPSEFPKQRKEEYNWVVFSGCVSTTLIVVLGDAMMLYRCFFVWRHKRWVLVIPGLCFLASTVFAGLFVAPAFELPRWSEGDLTFGALWAFTSVATNISLTCLIAWRLVGARRSISLICSPSDAYLKTYTGVLSILVESAVPLSVCGVGYAIIMAVAKPGLPGNVEKEAASVVFAGLYVAFAALSPQMIIFRVTTGSSWVGGARDQSNLSPSQVSSGGMVFAPSSSEVGKKFPESHSTGISSSVSDGTEESADRLHREQDK